MRNMGTPPPPRSAHVILFVIFYLSVETFDIIMQWADSNSSQTSWKPTSPVRIVLHSSYEH